MLGFFHPCFEGLYDHPYHTSFRLKTDQQMCDLADGFTQEIGKNLTLWYLLDFTIESKEGRRSSIQNNNWYSISKWIFTVRCWHSWIAYLQVYNICVEFPISDNICMEMDTKLDTLTSLDLNSCLWSNF